MYKVYTGPIGQRFISVSVASCNRYAASAARTSRSRLLGTVYLTATQPRGEPKSFQKPRTDADQMRRPVTPRVRLPSFQAP